MKLNCILWIVLISLCQLLYAGDKNPVIGVWELESAKWENPEAKNQFPSSEFDTQIKIITAKHFAWARQDTSQDINSFGSGPCSFKDNIYTEVLEKCSMKNMIGNTLHFKCEFKGDTWIMTGPCGEKGEKIDAGWTLHEVWKKTE